MTCTQAFVLHLCSPGGARAQTVALSTSCQEQRDFPGHVWQWCGQKTRQELLPLQLEPRQLGEMDGWPLCGKGLSPLPPRVSSGPLLPAQLTCVRCRLTFKAVEHTLLSSLVYLLENTWGQLAGFGQKDSSVTTACFGISTSSASGMAEAGDSWRRSS